MSAPRLSLCVVARDEARVLARCLASQPDQAAELLVADAGSRDRTAAIAEAAGATVMPVPGDWTLAAARNALLEQATCEWILVLDADEELQIPYGADLAALLEANPGAYRMPVYSPAGPALGARTYVAHRVRLFRRCPAHRFTGDFDPALPPEAEAAAAQAPPGFRVVHHGLHPDESARRARRNLARLRRISDVTALDLALQEIRLGQYARALPRLLTVVEDHPGAAYWHAFCHQRLADPAGALAGLEPACARWPDYTDLELLRGECLSACGRLPEAAAAFRRCLDLGDAPSAYGGALGAGSHLALGALGRLQAAVGDAAGATESLAAAYQAFPEDPEPLYSLAATLAASGRARELPARLGKLLDARDPQQLMLKADLLSVQRLFRPALQALDAAVRLAPHDPEVYYMRAVCRLSLGRPAEALADLRQVPADHALGPAALRRQVLGAWATGDCVTATALLAGPARKGLPSAALPAWRAIHQVLCRGGDPGEVVSAWGQAGAEVVLQAVDILLAAGVTALAERVARLMDGAGWSEGHRLLGLTYRLHGHRRLALDQFERALAAGCHDPDLLCWTAELELARRNWPRAHALARQAAEQAPANPLPHLLRAQIFRAQALELVRIGLRKEPADPELAALAESLGGGKP